MQSDGRNANESKENGLFYVEEIFFLFGDKLKERHCGIGK